MIFTETKLPGVYLIGLEPHADERGYFARIYCKQEFAARGLCTEWVQSSTSFNLRSGTLRGMHYQVAPHEEIKLVRCTRGAIYDVALDLRPDSITFRNWFAVELTPDCHQLLYISKGIAHGFLTLADRTEVSYQISTSYVADAARGVRWDDPWFGIRWPTTTNITISHKDMSIPDYRYTTIRENPDGNSIIP